MIIVMIQYPRLLTSTVYGPGGCPWPLFHSEVALVLSALTMHRLEANLQLATTNNLKVCIISKDRTAH
jgi:hypothetical protein